MAMELFFQLLSTLVFSLFFSFLLAKLFSILSDHDENDFKNTSQEQRFQAEFKDYSFVSKIVGFDELSDQFTEKILIDNQEFTNLSSDDRTEVEILYLKEHDNRDKLFNESPQRKVDMVLINEEVGIEKREEIEIINNEEEDCREVEVVDSKEQENVNKQFDESPHREIAMSLVNEEVGIEQSEEIEIINNEEVIYSEINEEGWEELKKSELEKLFDAAVEYVASIGDDDNKKGSVGSDLKLQFYGLKQIAIEGPCYVPQPNVLKLSARAKWNAWQQLGNMSPDMAMERYINLLCNNIPGWTKDASKLSSADKEELSF